MPWHIGTSESCPASRPVAVIKTGTDEVAGCHESAAGAAEQIEALYASEGSDMRSSVERRHTAAAWPDADIELRADANGLVFRGYAAVFESPSQDLGGFREVIKPGAFRRSIESATNGRNPRDIKFFLNHNSDVVLGSTRAGTLRLTEDDRGLLATGELPNSTWGQPVAEAIRRGDISGMSFGFMVDKKGDAWSADHTIRTLTEVRLLEVSVVTGWPAYTATTASVRSLIDAIDWTDEDSARSIIDGLTDEQRQIILSLLNRQSPTPYLAPDVAAAYRRLDAMRHGTTGG